MPQTTTMWDYINQEFARASEVDKMQLQRFNSMAGQVLQAKEQENQVLMNTLQQSNMLLDSLMGKSLGAASLQSQHDIGMRQADIEDRRTAMAERQETGDLAREAHAIEYMRALVRNPRMDPQGYRRLLEGLNVTEEEASRMSPEAIINRVDSELGLSLQGPGGERFRVIPNLDTILGQGEDDVDRRRIEARRRLGELTYGEAASGRTQIRANQVPDAETFREIMRDAEVTGTSVEFRDRGLWGSVLGLFPGRMTPQQFQERQGFPEEDLQGGWIERTVPGELGGI